MSLLQDNRRTERSSKKLYMVCGVGLIILIFIIVALLALVTSLKNNTLKLIVNSKTYSVNEYLISKDDTVYIDLENLTKAITGDGYIYRKGNRDIEDDNQCYITNNNLQESVFFKVGSDDIYKSGENTTEVINYKLSKPVIKQNEKIYIPIEDCKVALNMRYTKTKNQYTISTIEYLEKFYNQQASSYFTPDTSIVWETLASNKKLLREGLVVVKDASGNLGIAKISSTTDSKTKVTKVTTTPIIAPKYKYIKYVEKYNQLIVETSSGRGIVELIKSDDGNFSVKTIIGPQYDDIKQLDESRFIISEIDDTNSSKSTKYGIINKNGEEILPAEYQKIGVDASQFTNNSIENEYLIFNYLIPVKKNDLWGFVNLNGQTIIDTKYTDLGCKETNSSSNVLIIPNEEFIVIKSDKTYGIITKTGKIVFKPVLTKVYLESENGTDKYYMIYNDKKVDILDFYKRNSASIVKEQTETENANNDKKIEIKDEEQTTKVSIN